MLNRIQYEIKAKYIPTNRLRTIRLWAKSEEHAKELLNAQEYGEITSFETLFESPTQNQIEYARDLGIQISDTDTKTDVSALIDRKISKDTSDPNPGLKEFANNHDIVFSSHIGKKGLYNLIFHNLPTLDRIAFFIFSIYRYYSNDRNANLDNSAFNNTFYDFARITVDNPKLVKSLDDNYSGADLRYFGTLQSYGRTLTGGSRQTSIFKAAKGFLISKNLLTEIDFSAPKSIVQFKESSKIILDSNLKNINSEYADPELPSVKSDINSYDATGCGCSIIFIIVLAFIIYRIFF